MNTTTALRHLTLTALAACTLPAALAGPVLTGGTETATTDAYGRDVTRGYDFVSTTNQLLTALGLWDHGADGLPATHPVGLWETGTQTLLASVTVDNGDPLDLTLTVEGGNWRYETLAVPVALTAGTTYTLAWFTGGNYNAASSLYINYPTLAVAPTVTITNQKRELSGAFSFPTLTSTAGTVFVGMPNAQLVPEPGSALLLCAGGLGLLLRRRRAQG